MPVSPTARRLVAAAVPAVLALTLWSSPVHAVGAATAWPGGSTVKVVDKAKFFGQNLSGLAYETNSSARADRMYAVQNGPSRLYRLSPSGSLWVAPSSGVWAHGRTLTFPDGKGKPDAEGVTLVDDRSANGIYVASESNLSVANTSRPSILRYDPLQSGTTLRATQEWDLTTFLPTVSANKGTEAVAWVPDSYLTQNALTDISTGRPYDPDSPLTKYGPHSGGVFFTALEGSGTVYGFVLEDNGTITEVTESSSGLKGVMDLSWSPEGLRVVCDNTCHGQVDLMTAQGGALATTKAWKRPSGMKDLNNEGFTSAPAARCTSGKRPAYWAEDGTSKNVLRRGTLNCTG